jgi:hypothetical protein
VEINNLNPYGDDYPILQLEKVDFPPDKRDDLQALDPPFCLAVSAKRYVLFNRQNGSVVVRKASGHGLGHLMVPYCPSSDDLRHIAGFQKGGSGSSAGSDYAACS